MVLESFHGGSVALPVSAWVVKGLHLATLTLHIAVMNILLGSALLYAVALFAGQEEGVSVPRLPVWMAFTINTGVAPLLFCQALLASFIYTSSILIAGWWIGAVPLLMAAYYLSYLATSKSQGPLRRWASLVTAILLLFVSFIFVSNIDLMENPREWTRYFDSPHGWILFTGGAGTLLRWIHVILAALFHALLLGRVLGKAGSLDGRLGLWLGGFFLSLLAGTGLAHYSLLPDEVAHQAARGVINLVPVLVSAGVLGLIYLSGRLKLTLGWAVANLTLMVLFREDIRNGFLAPVTTTGPTDYGSLVMFALSLAVGGAALGYMLSLLGKGGNA